MKRVALLSAVVVVTAIAAAPAYAVYPDKPIRLIVAYAPGTSADLTARQVEPKFAEHLGQRLIIDNRAGAGGIIGTDLTAKAAPDGYTITMGTSLTHAATTSLYKNVPYDPVKDFAAVGRMDSATFVLVVGTVLPVNSVQDLIAYAKARPGKLNFASSGNGTTAHLAGALFNIAAGVDLTHVPYNGATQALIDVSSGQDALMFYPYQPLVALIDAGKLRPLATTAAQRASFLPNAPTMIESGVKDFLATTWHGIYAPAGTPKDIVNTLYAALAKAMKEPDVVAKMKASGNDVDLAGPDEFAAFTRDEVERTRKVVELSGAKIE